MKKTIYYAAISVILAGGLFTSCKTGTKKVEDAKENVQEANKELKAAQQELNAEYPAFKIEAEAKIAANEIRIAELQKKLNKPGVGLLDEGRKKRIEELQQKNANLRNMLVVYEKENSDWETFKREFNHDMDGLGEAIKDFFENSKK